MSNQLTQAELIDLAKQAGFKETVWSNILGVKVESLAKFAQLIQQRQGQIQDDIEQMAVNRYRPVPDGLMSYKVLGGDGSRSLFKGTKEECQIIARKLTEAFLDGIHVAFHHAEPVYSAPPTTYQLVAQALEQAQE